MLADRLGAAFLDTGVLYRALTLQALERGVNPADESALAELARRRAEQTGDVASEPMVHHDMEQRDAQDRGRLTAPLEPALDAVIIETDGVPIEAVVEEVYALVPVAQRGG